MAYESTDTVIYRPDGLDAVTLCKQGDLMAAPVDVTASVQVQRTACWAVPGCFSGRGATP